MAPYQLPRIIGHRGAAAHAPENTLAGFRKAHALGVGWVEFDVRLTGDGRCIVLHDDTIDRTTDGSGAAADMTLEMLAAWDAGAWFDPGFAGEAIPTFEETIDLLGELGLGANVEIKPHPGTEIETAEAVCRILRTSWPASLPAPLVSSFAYPALETAHRLAPELARGLLLGRVGDDWRRLADGIEAHTIHCDHVGLTESRAREIRAASYPLLAYTVNHAGRARELFDWGVCGVFSDAPDRVAGAT
ncbi:MAG: glycerophosphoryl diester phosphodiesterase [Aliidongia sp.]|nr:glycerophosphoryl diester phosphodiesterase [Aliidongia sp.]